MALVYTHVLCSPAVGLEAPDLASACGSFKARIEMVSTWSVMEKAFLPPRGPFKVKSGIDDKNPLHTRLVGVAEATKAKTRQQGEPSQGCRWTH